MPDNALDGAGRTEQAGAGQMLDRREPPPKRSDLVLACVLGIVCSLAVVPVMYDNFDAPFFVWAFLVVWGVLIGYVGHRAAWERFHPKPWIERRKTPRP